MRIVIPQEDENQKKELSKKFKDYEIDYAEADIGGGADWWITIIILGGALFFQGKNINENLDAWKDIGNKIKSIFKKKESSNFLDKEAAIALSIAKISEKTKIKKIELTDSKSIIGKETNTKGFKLNFAPLDYYILTFKVNRIENFIFCVKSNGEIRFQDYFERSEWNYEFNWDSYEERENYNS
ncbi:MULTISPECIES: hypothetical protein [Mesonia]|uniref:Uncharacterized protein n=1 Tax=Mesonia oceanica TaxID=2687242 RepID=A0AC61YBX3_9FLAO|nr:MULTISPECIES: hypothetical protein [Mesonia]MAN29217.1 hypothetical protein [Mesonia sp.]MAQ39959.1 hypothetical protein [Mesonia sp.]MBJ99092.1 hypothetical protein [Flavobacteriaceae bacterium]VVV01996.1 hypothetical protein FVB9532_03291 [Mesonia oceanica]|tara:strand:- start:83 stop:634 length:552 start_codon:yes stop_codon:yes gene_type:complete